MVASGSTESLDLVDDHDRSIGRVERAAVHGDPSLQHRAVHVLVRNGRGELFLQRRSSTKDIAPGLWDTSVGGHVAAGESYCAAARRELTEELGVPIGAVELHLLHRYIWRNAVETEHVRTFELRHEGPFALHPEEIEEGRFWSDRELQGAVGGGALTGVLEHELSLLGRDG